MEFTVSCLRAELNRHCPVCPGCGDAKGRRQQGAQPQSYLVWGFFLTPNSVFFLHTGSPSYGGVAQGGRERAPRLSPLFLSSSLPASKVSCGNYSGDRRSPSSRASPGWLGALCGRENNAEVAFREERARSPLGFSAVDSLAFPQGQLQVRFKQLSGDLLGGGILGSGCELP